MESPPSLTLGGSREEEIFRPRTGRKRTNLLSNQYEFLPSNFLLSPQKSKGKIISSTVSIKNKAQDPVEARLVPGPQEDFNMML